MKPIKASFFAGPEDVHAFLHCKSLGGTDEHCFLTGDNGVGKWGHDCTNIQHPMCALPREVWKDAGKTGGALIDVTYKGHTVRGILGDTLPNLVNIHNGVLIDLNPGYAVAFNIPVDYMNSHTLEGVTWSWV